MPISSARLVLLIGRNVSHDEVGDITVQWSRRQTGCPALPSPSQCVAEKSQAPHPVMDLVPAVLARRSNLVVPAI
jgi:hypothetical protein